MTLGKFYHLRKKSIVNLKLDNVQIIFHAHFDVELCRQPKMIGMSGNFLARVHHRETILHLIKLTFSSPKNFKKVPLSFVYNGKIFCDGKIYYRKQFLTDSEKRFKKNSFAQPMFHYAYNSWIKKTTAKAIDCLGTKVLF